MIIKKIPLNNIITAKYNPRKDLKPSDPEYKKLKKDMDVFGLVEPLVWNSRTGNLVGGHQRLKIIKARGDSEVEVSVVDLDEQKEKVLNIALNKIQGDWDQDKLQELLTSMTTQDVLLTGFDLEDIKIDDLTEKNFDLEDFIFDDIEVPCWFVIRADLTEYDKLKDQIAALNAKGIKKEDSQDGQYEP